MHAPIRASDHPRPPAGARAPATVPAPARALPADVRAPVLTPADVLRLQRSVGNRAVGEFLAARRIGAGAVQREVGFTRFEGAWGLFNWGSYNEAELRIRKRVGQVKEQLEGLQPWTQEARYERRIAALARQFGAIDGKSYPKAQYADVEERLDAVFTAADQLSSRIAARDVQRDRDLDAMLSGSFQVVQPEAVRARSTELSARELAELRALLADVFHGRASSLKIDPLTPFANLDLAQRADSLGLDAPPELLPLELTYQKNEEALLGRIDARAPLRTERTRINQDRGMGDGERALALAAVNAKIGKLDGEIEALEGRSADVKADYLGIVEEMVRREVMRDLVKIARTGVGRDLLREVATRSRDRVEQAVTIRAYDQYRSATAGQDSNTQKLYVDYTPQYFRDRDTRQRGEGGAIAQAEALAAHNPWQENRRTDVTLMHELVHTHHFQEGTAKLDNALVTQEGATDAIDAPYGDNRGVRQEEYFTVGLGAHTNERITENRYRAETRALGEDVKARGYYTHKNEEGERVELPTI